MERTGAEPAAGAFASGAAFEARYREDITTLLLEHCRVLLVAAILLFPMFWFLDRFHAAALASSFLLIRGVVVGVYVLSLATTYLPTARALILPVSVGFASASAVSISVMSAMLGGFSSNYFVGEVIVVFLVGFFMPWTLRATLVFCALVLSSYVALNLAVSPFDQRVVEPLFFLGTTCVCTCVNNATKDRDRRRDLALRLELEQKHEELKELDEAKTRFFANVSHELRTPLMLIMAPLEGLREREPDPERAALYRAMAANAARLLRQVNALLDAAKLEAGNLRLELDDGEVGALLRDLVASATPLAVERGITLRAEALDGLPASRFDAEKVEVIAANLISNALKFTPRGGHVTVRAAAPSRPDRIAFEVADDGRGIPESELERIFERFHQVDGSHERDQEGTGLGLSLARELARLHDGDLTVESALGRGSRFRVELALAPPEGAPDRRKGYRRKADRLAATRAEAQAASHYAARTGRSTLLADLHLPRLVAGPEPAPISGPADAPLVLIVEDNADLRAVLAQRLRARYRVATAEDGADGLERARALRPDAVLTDVMMPRVSGYELIARLREDPALRRIPVILATAKAGAEAVVEGLACGADDYVTKPFDVRELEARLEAQLRARRLEGELDERDSRLQAIGKMTREILHDLKNPLSAVLGFAAIAKLSAESGAPAEAIALDLEPVVSQAERLRRMVEEVLDFARGRAPEIRLEPTPLAPLLAEALAGAEMSLRPLGIQLVREIDLPEGALARIDRDRVLRALENVLTNAREAIQSKPGRKGGSGAPDRIVVQVGIDGDFAQVRIADTGPGIPAAIMTTLFEPMVSAGKPHGCGLGLATARNVLRAHGSEIEVESPAPEGGAAFSLRLPLEAPRAAPARTELAGARR